MTTTMETWIDCSRFIVPLDAVGSVPNGMAWTIYLPPGTLIEADLPGDGQGYIRFRKPNPLI